MKIKKKFMKINPLGIYKLKMALKQENIAIALDAIISIKSEKRPELEKTTLDKIENHLIFLVTQVNLDKNSMKKHFEWLYSLISCDNYQGKLI